MKSNFKPQKEVTILLKKSNTTKRNKTYDDVRQDNRAPRRERVASSQASRIREGTRAHPLNKNTVRIKKHSNKRQTVQVTGWVSKKVSAEIDRIAAEKGITRSRTIATLLEEAVNWSIEKQYATLLKPVIQQAIRKESRKERARFAELLVRVAYDANVSRNLAFNILGRQPGVTVESLNRIKDWSNKKAKDSIINRTAQIDDLIRAMEESDEPLDQETSEEVSINQEIASEKTGPEKKR